MTEEQEKINDLTNKLDSLLAKHEIFSKEIINLREEIIKLRTSKETTTPFEQQEKPIILTNTETTFKPENKETFYEVKEQPKPIIIKPQPYTYRQEKEKEEVTSKIKNNIEKFIGENLINKIGIFITIIGVAIGAKYSIDHQLISPLTRIILCYLVGFGLLGVGLKLKKNYTNYSAVLVSGAMAIMYFTTFAAYSFYALMPQAAAFGLMVLFTVFTVITALKYDNQVISLIGLVGAYAVPFLLSDGSGKVVILYSYMAIINIGILAIAFKKYWKILYYSSFALTWIIFTSWLHTQYIYKAHFTIAFSFLLIFFAIFYTTFLAYKLVRKEKFEVLDIILLLTNSFIFYGFGYFILHDQVYLAKNLGLFTIANAIVHLMVSAIIYKQKLGDRNLYYLESGLFLVFVTIAIPVQLHGNWITLLWVAEAALLFWIGRTKNVSFYEILSYLLMFLAFFSVLTDITITNTPFDIAHPENGITPFFNITFLSSLIFIACFGFINIMNLNKKHPAPWVGDRTSLKFMDFIIPGIFIFVLYFTFLKEIVSYWDQLYNSSMLSLTLKGQTYSETHYNYDLDNFKTIWVINYSLIFFTILSFINYKKFKNQYLGYINLGVNILFIFMFLTFGLFMLSELRESYLQQTLAQYYQRGIFNILIRYISFVFLVATIHATYKYILQEFLPTGLKVITDILFYFCILWVASSELINWMDIAHSTQSYKLGLSIFWGIFSLLLIVLGIWKQKKHLRIGAIVLFGITLLKLFVYDIAYLDTISKTIVFVSLGILLLIISFLYNKYKNLITNETEE